MEGGAWGEACRRRVSSFLFLSRRLFPFLTPTPAATHLSVQAQGASVPGRRRRRLGGLLQPPQPGGRVFGRGRGRERALDRGGVVGRGRGRTAAAAAATSRGQAGQGDGADCDAGEGLRRVWGWGGVEERERARMVSVFFFFSRRASAFSERKACTRGPGAPGVQCGGGCPHPLPLTWSARWSGLVRAAAIGRENKKGKRATRVCERARARVFLAPHFLSFILKSSNKQTHASKMQASLSSRLAGAVPVTRR